MIESIKQVVIDKETLEKAQFVDLNKEKSLISAVRDAYFVSERIGRMPYAKP